MLSFLLGRKMFDGATVHRCHLNQVMEVMGLREHMGNKDDKCEDAEAGTIGINFVPEPEPEVKKKARWVVGLLERYAETVALFSAASPQHFAHPEVMYVPVSPRFFFFLPLSVLLLDLCRAAACRIKKRVTLHKPPFIDAATGYPGGETALRADFRRANALDYELYEAAVFHFNAAVETAR